MNSYCFEEAILNSSSMKTLQDKFALTTEECSLLLGGYSADHATARLKGKIILLCSLDMIPQDNRIQATLHDILFRGIGLELFAKVTQIEETLLTTMQESPEKMSAENKYRIYGNALSARYFLNDLYALLKEKQLVKDDSEIMEMTHNDARFLEKLDYEQLHELNGEASFRGKLSAYFSALPDIDTRIQSLLQKYVSENSLSFAVMAKLSRLALPDYEIFMKNPYDVPYEKRISMAALATVLHTFYMMW